MYIFGKNIDNGEKIPLSKWLILFNIAMQFSNLLCL